MPNIITPFPLIKNHHSFNRGDMSGSVIAHHDLLLWAMRSDKSMQCHLLVETLGAFRPDNILQLIRSSLRTLDIDIASRVFLTPATKATSTDVYQGGPVVALGRSVDFAELALLRNLSPAPFPITAIVHAVLFPSVVPALLTSVVHSRSFDTFVATSEAGRTAIQSLLYQTRDSILTKFPKLQEEDVQLPRVCHIPLGVNDEYLNPTDKQWARRQLQIPEEAMLLLYVGRLSRRYKADLSSLLYCFCKLAHAHPSLHLLLAGNTVHSEGEDPLSEIDDEAIRRRIHVIHNFPQALKTSIYSAADIFVSPVDNIQETFGISLLEAMAAGLPVIGTNWSGYRDIVVEGQTGFLVDSYIDPHCWENADRVLSFSLPPATEYYLARRTILDVHQLLDRIRTLINNDQLRAQFGEAGRRRVKDKFLWSNLILQYGSLWKQQVDECHHEEPRDRCGLHLRPAFEHYCNGVLRRDSPIYVQADEASEDVPLRVADQELERLLRIAKTTPLPLDKLMALERPAYSGKSIRLMKSGHLKIAVKDTSYYNAKEA